MREMVDKKTWEEFRAAGLLWWTNRMLHLLGWAICVEVDSDGLITDAFPARCKFRGFTEKIESEGFETLTRHIGLNLAELIEEAADHD